MAGSVTLTDNTATVLSAMRAAKARALEKVGGQAETNVKGLTPTATGALKNSFTHQVDGDVVTIGSSIEYAPYVELGTGKEYSPPEKWVEAQGERGRGLDSWIYHDATGFHRAFPQKGKHMLQYGINNHLSEYAETIKSELKKG